jgi:hypothetical protein
LENSHVKTQPNCPSWIAKDDLGNKIENKTIICVEDEKAKSFLEAIIRNQYFELLKHIDIITCEGESKIITIIEAINMIKLKNFIGVLDGDYPLNALLQKRIDGGHPGLMHLLKLPGESIPEVLVVDFIEDHLTIFAPNISRPILQTRDAIANAKTNVDHHEWVSAAATQLGQNKDFIWEIMIKIWVDNNQDDVKTFFTEFIKEFSSPKSF